MTKYNISIFLVIVIIFGVIVWLTQKDSIGKSTLFSNGPSITLPPSGLSLLPTAGGGQQTEPQQQIAQQPQVPVGDVEQGPPSASVSATIKTTKGNITISLVYQDAPNAINNFLTKVKSGFYNNLTFHRVEDWVIQGGDPKGNGTGGGAMKSELNSKSFTSGSVGYAAASTMEVGQGERISNDSQFFIVKSDATHLDGQYTNFGTVTEGMDVVNKIQKGDKILSITVE